MGKLLVTTGLAVGFLLPAVAFGESHVSATTAKMNDSTVQAEASEHAAMSMPIFGSDLIGARVYTGEAPSVDADTLEINQDWDDIGEVHDLVLSRDGKLQAVLVDVGGFLGIGEKTVALQMNELTISTEGANDAEDWFVVFPGSKESVESLPEYENPYMASMERGAEADAVTPTSVMVSNETDRAWDGNGVMMREAPAIEREGYEVAKIDDLTSEDLTGIRVYDARDEWVGEISELLVTTDGMIDKSIVDVGGFLGMGEKPVAVSFKSLTIKREVNGDDLRAYMDVSKEELEKMPTYEK